MSTNTNQIVMDIEAAIQAAESVLPTILGVVGVFSPGAKALIPFLPLLQVALTTVQQVATVIEGDVAAATTTVTNNLTSMSASTPASAAPTS